MYKFIIFLVLFKNSLSGNNMSQVPINLIIEQNARLDTLFNQNEPDIYEINSELITACELDNLDAVNRLLTIEGIELDTSNYKGKTPLIVSAKLNRLEIVESLLKAIILTSEEEIINLQDRKSNTALMIAVRYNHEEIVELLLNANADVSKINLSKCSALSISLNSFNIKLFKMIYRYASEEDIKVLYEDKKNILMIASKIPNIIGGTHGKSISIPWNDQEYIDIIKDIANKINLYHRNDFGYNSLFVAIQDSNYRMIEILLNIQENLIKTVDFSGMKPISFLNRLVLDDVIGSSFTYETMLKQMLISGAKIIPFNILQLIENSNILEIVLRVMNQEKIQLSENHIAIIFIEAAKRELIDEIKILINNNLNINSVNTDGRSVLTELSRFTIQDEDQKRYLTSIMRTLYTLLQLRELNIDIKDETGSTALINLVNNSLVSLNANFEDKLTKQVYQNICFLLDRGADTDVVNNQGDTYYKILKRKEIDDIHMDKFKKYMKEDMIYSSGTDLE